VAYAGLFPRGMWKPGKMSCAECCPLSLKEGQTLERSEPEILPGGTNRKENDIYAQLLIDKRGDGVSR